MSPTILDQMLYISDLFQRDMARAFAGTPLTPARVRVLWVLQHRGPSTQQTLAGELDVSARNVSALVDALEGGGYVRRTPHPSDRRAFVVELTASATEQMSAMQREHAELGEMLLRAVAPRDRAALVRGLGAIAARLTDLVDGAAVAADAGAPR